MYNAIIRDKLIEHFGLEASIQYAKMEAFALAYRAETLDSSIFKDGEYTQGVVSKRKNESEWWKSEAKYMEKQLNIRQNEHKTGISEGVRATEGMDEA